MAAANPDSGAFAIYTAKAYGPAADVAVAWLWCIQLVVVVVVVVVITAGALGADGLLATILPACRCG